MKPSKKAQRRLEARQNGMRETHANVRRLKSNIDPAKSYRMPGSRKK